MEENMNGSTPPPLDQEVVVGEAINSGYEPNKKFTQSFTFKVLFIALLSLLLLIPSLMISSLGEERKKTATNAENEIASKWGMPQHITGPVIAIPCVEGNQKDMYYILPKTLNVNADVKSQTLYRNIYEAVVYNSSIDIDGTFNINSLLPIKNDSVKVLLNEAYVEMGITDLRGISKKVQLNLGGKITDVNDGGTDGNIQYDISPEDESEYDVVVAESAYKEYVDSGHRSTPVQDFWIEMDEEGSCQTLGR